MPELRKDPVVGRWIIIASERAARPSDYQPNREPIKENSICPFCPGHEDKTPPEIFAIRQIGTNPNTPGWKVRVIPNKFPALIIQNPLKRQGEGIYDRMAGVGAHEVIIETPEHSLSLDKFDEKSIADFIFAYKARVVDLANDKRFRYIMIFKNHGASAGASLSHPHSQLIAMPIIPKHVKEEIDGARQYYDFKERCIFCDIIKQELEDNKRLVRETNDFISFEPFAARFPFETWIISKRHFTSFFDITDNEVYNLSVILKDLVTRVNKVLSSPDYNFFIHTAPLDSPCLEHYHFHIEFIPKLTKIAGFEVGSGFYINTTPPEDAARYLKECECVN
ncbi:MAG: galactose-1-phosphate uridylyltransferase [candidate division WOR-3 bacterium]